MIPQDFEPKKPMFDYTFKTKPKQCNEFLARKRHNSIDYIARKEEIEVIPILKNKKSPRKKGLKNLQFRRGSAPDQEPS